MPGKGSKTFLRTLKVWEGLVCDDIVKLHRLGKLNKDWWEYPVVFSEEHKDAMYVFLYADPIFSPDPSFYLHSCLT